MQQKWLIMSLFVVLQYSKEYAGTVYSKLVYIIYIILHMLVIYIKIINPKYGI